MLLSADATSSDTSPVGSVTGCEGQLVRPGYQRRYAPKTRSGCITCKIRRIKCDEAKPACNRCRSTGRKCDGYIVQKEPDRYPGDSVRFAPSTDLIYSASERRTFDFFRSKTVPTVSGNFRDPIWNRTILQISQSEPTLRHAANALGALHEERHSKKATNKTSLTSPKHGFAAQQYTKALIGMQKLMKERKTPLEVILLCSLACLHFEALRENFAACLLHGNNAIQLIRSASAHEVRNLNPHIIRAFMRMDLQASLYLGMRIPVLPFNIDALDAKLPIALDDVVSARDLVYTWSFRLFHFMRSTADQYKYMYAGDVPLEVWGTALTLESAVIRIDELLTEYLNRPSLNLTLSEQHGLALLRVRAKTDRIIAVTCLRAEACCFDQFADLWEDVVNICEWVIDGEHSDMNLYSASLDEGLILPLFYVGLQCRISRLRHRAIDLLEQLRKWDDVWHLVVTIAIVRAIMDMEEAHCEDVDFPTPADIPEWRRLHGVGFDQSHIYAPGEEVRVLVRTRPNGMDGEWESHQIMLPIDQDQEERMSEVIDLAGGRTISPLSIRTLSTPSTAPSEP